jgi:hypothetical protein
MDARNTQQRKRRAEMTDEQREESKRRHCEYQRQYRAWKRAELQNNSTTVVLNQDDAEIIVPASSPAGEKYLSTYAFHQPPEYIIMELKSYSYNICEGVDLETGLSTIVETDESVGLATQK